MRVLLLSMALLCIAACSTSGPPGTEADLTPPAFAERPPPAVPQAIAAAPMEPGAPTPLMPVSEPAVPSPPVAVAAPPPVAVEVPPAAAPEPAVAVAVASPFPFVFPWLFAGVTPPDPFRAPPPRLTLSNFSYDRAHVEAVVTVNADCDARDPGVYAASEFDLAYSGTRVIEAPAGNDVCWRRDLASGDGGGAAAPNWSRWSRAYLSAGRSVDSRL